jgi:hypothetical protein
MECSRKRKASKRSRESLLAAKPPTPLPRQAFPDEFAELLHKGLLRRQTGVLLLGSAERELMLAETLSVIKTTGPSWQVIPGYRFWGTELFTQSLDTVAGSSLPCLRGSLICPSFRPLFGALCWSGFQGTRHAVALYDAFVPGERSLNTAEYERPAVAVRDWRQMRWERRALRLLDSNRVTWRQLRHHLFISGLIDPDLDFEAADWAQTKDGLRSGADRSAKQPSQDNVSPPSTEGGWFHYRECGGKKPNKVHCREQLSDRLVSVRCFRWPCDELR